MAYWQRKMDKYVFVYYTHPESGSVKGLPRRIVKHLDKRTDHEINLWVEEWTRLHEAQVARPDTIGLTPELDTILKSYWHYLTQEKERAPNTLANHKRWLKWAVEFFNMQPLAAWNKTSKDFGAWVMNEKKKSQEEALGANRALRRFWNWAEEEDLVEGVLKIRGGKKKWKPTPLKNTLNPDQALSLIGQVPAPLNLMVLLGYFFSLRPQETYSITREKFLAGKKAEVLEACEVMKAHGLYSKLAVYINVQKTEKGMMEDPKAHSIGWVACFDERAAKLAVEMLREFDGFPKRPNAYYNQWTEIRKQLGIKFTLKDLRRASVYWLGHYTTLPGIAVKNHARHRLFSTTELYLRRPEEDAEMGKLDLDA